ncbi:MAG: LuxR C-terminal-related transcriptional regulator [Anaerolineales bacterium]|nr:LuxR C-terminal-related transcriptional regulator [Anaerolineales bacterium]
MSIWRKLLSLIGLRPISAPRKYQVSESMQVTLTTLAEHEGRPENELIQDLVTAGLTQYYESEDLWRKWRSLTPREQDVAALACLGFTNREIAARLNIAPDTVKSRLHNVLRKFNIHKRTDLRVMLADWDFSAWQ